MKFIDDLKEEYNNKKTTLDKVIMVSELILSFLLIILILLNLFGLSTIKFYAPVLFLLLITLGISNLIEKHNVVAIICFVAAFINMVAQLFMYITK